jgi:hypothetical protein
MPAAVNEKKPSGGRSGLEALGNVALAVGSLVLTLALAEAAFRLLGIRAEWHQPRQDLLVREGRPGLESDPVQVEAPFSLIRSVYDSDPRGYFGPRCFVDHVHNSVGFRDSEHAIAKPAETIRILGLGDSYLWGQGVRAEDVVLARLGRELGGLVEGRRVETINAGFSGANTVFERDLLKARGLDYDPDLVIVHFVLNDVEDDVDRPGPRIEFFDNYTTLYLSPDAPSAWSHLWGWARQRCLVSWRARRYVSHCVATFREDSPGWVHCREALLDIRTTCRRRHIGLLVVVFPFFHELDGAYPFQVVHDAVRGFCEGHGIPVLDLREAYRGYRGPELWVHPTDQHPNELAHAIAARALAQRLRGDPELGALLQRVPSADAVASPREGG